MTPELERLVAAFRDYLVVPDPSHILFSHSIAVGATDVSGEPCWGLIIGVPASGKTEVLRSLDDAADEHLDEITAPGLLSWLPGKKARETGLLARNNGRHVFATIGDLSTLLAKSDRGDRDQLYSILRRAYDGRVVREVGNAPRPLRWEGRLTLLAAVTPAVDRYASHGDELGPRWLYLRMPDTTMLQRRQAARMMRASSASLPTHRERVRELTSSAVATAREKMRDLLLDDATGDRLDTAALVTCLGRASVPRDGYGRREIIGVATVEEPPRLVAQLEKLTRASIALGLSTAEAIGLAERAALDSMPLPRRKCLAELATGEQLSQAEIARRAGIDRAVARAALEEFAAIGVATYAGADTDDDGRRGPWRLDGENAPMVVDVMSRRDVAKSVHQPPIPPYMGAGHTSQHPAAEASAEGVT